MCFNNNEVNQQIVDTLGKMETNWTKIAKNYITTRQEILKPYILRSKNHGPAKRQALIMGAIGLGSLVFGGISEYQIHKVNDHLKDVDENIETIKKSLKEYHSQMVLLKNNLIGLVKADIAYLRNYVENYLCDNMVENYQSKREFHFDRITGLIDNVLSGAIEGKNKLELNPRILKPNTLKLIVSQHSILNNSIFFNNPHLLYSLAKINLISIDESITTAHFVMQIPIIKSDATLYDLYKSTQVGTYVKNNTCRYSKIPVYS
jgi:hypothetical protein